MKPVSRVNPATDETKDAERNSASHENFGSKSSSSESNSALTRKPSNGPTLGADAELGEDAEHDEEGKGMDFSHRAQELATRFGDRAKEYGGKAVEQTGTFVKNHPGPTLLAGFGVGILVGVAIARR